MRRTLSVFVLFFMSLAICDAQVQGSYYSNGFLITISDSLAVIRYPENHLPTRFTDTVAVCKITPESDAFIRIDSQSPYDTVLDCMNVKEGVMETGSTDSLYISFKLPTKYLSHKISIMDLYEVNSQYDIIIPTDTTIVLPKRGRYGEASYYWGIEPNGKPAILELYNLYSVSYLFPVFPLKLKTNTESYNELIVSVPCIDDGFFERVWIQGEYIKLIENGLEWRGMTFYLESIDSIQ